MSCESTREPSLVAKALGLLCFAVLWIALFCSPFNVMDLVNKGL